jgi:hypothetical protein
MSSILEERRVQRAELIGLAKEFAARARQELGSVTAWTYGSVARGDFNVWSDVDVLIVVENLPQRPPDRFGLLLRLAPPGVEPKGYTLLEFQTALHKGDPQLVEALRDRVLLCDDLELEDAMEAAVRDAVRE